MVMPVFGVATVPSLMACDDMIFVDGFVSESLPSAGSGGAVNTGTRTIYVNSQLGNQTYYYHIPSTYQATTAMPLMMLFHGQAGQGGAPGAAQYLRNLWKSEAESNNFIIVAQVATGPQSGSWVPSNMVPILIKIIDDMSLRYNIEQRRIYAWGFSAGGHILHELALLNADFFAAYAISGASLSFANSGNVGPQTASRKLPVVLSVGLSDPYYPTVLADFNSFQLHGWQTGYNLWMDTYIGGHQYFVNEPSNVWDKLCISTNIN